MSSKKAPGEELEGDITFIATPAPAPQKFGTGVDCGVEVTNVSTSPGAIELSAPRRLTPIDCRLTQADTC